MSLFSSKPRLAEVAVKSGMLSRAQLRAAAEAARRAGISLPEQLLAGGLIDEERLARLLAEALEVPVLGLDSLTIDEAALARVPPDLLRTGGLLPLKQLGRTLTVAMADPGDAVTLDALARATGLKILPMLAPMSALREARQRIEALARLRRGDEGTGLEQYAPFFEKLADYRFERVLGQGGFGLVCRCHQVVLGRPVAIKVLNPNWHPVAQVLERFKREGQIIARLDHPAIIKVYEQGECDGFRFIAMEFFEGQALDEHLRGRDWARKLSVMIQVCGAIAYAHRQGVIHRDIKPANILVNALGAIKLLDFGVAHYDVMPSGLTGPHVVLGTPKYMAPELNLGADKASVASDMFAFGLMTLELLTGATLQGAPPVHPSQQEPRIPRALGDALLRCLCTEPAARPGSMAAMEGLFQQAMDRLIFGDTAAGPRQAPGGAAPAAGSGVASLERLFEFKAVLRKDERIKTMLAHNHRLGREVVIKLMEQSAVAPALLTACGGEAGTGESAALYEPHIAETYGLGRHGALVLAVTEHLAGGPLGLQLGREHSPGRIVDWLEGLVLALAHAARAGQAHGRLHPGNVVLDEVGTAKLTDFGFGIACEPHPEWPRYALVKPRAGAGGRAMPGAPDAAAADRHALDVLAWELITAKPLPAGFRAAREYEAISHDPRIHPLLRYFLGRCWGVRENLPRYDDYAAMREDLARIRQRLASQPEWTGDGAAAGRSPIGCAEDRAAASPGAALPLASPGRGSGTRLEETL